MGDSIELTVIGLLMVLIVVICMIIIGLDNKRK